MLPDRFLVFQKKKIIGKKMSVKNVKECKKLWY